MIELTQFDRVPTIDGYPFYRFELITNIQNTVYQIWIASSDSSMLSEEDKAAGLQVVLNYPSVIEYQFSKDIIPILRKYIGQNPFAFILKL